MDQDVDPMASPYVDLNKYQGKNYALIIMHCTLYLEVIHIGLEVVL